MSGGWPSETTPRSPILNHSLFLRCTLFVLLPGCLGLLRPRLLLLAEDRVPPFREFLRFRQTDANDAHGLVSTIATAPRRPPAASRTHPGRWPRRHPTFPVPISLG